MPKPSISERSYLEAFQGFHWAVKEQVILWFTGRVVRHRRTEVALKRLFDKGKLIRQRYGRRYAYAAPRRKGYQKLFHGLVCTECLVRAYRSKPGKVIKESKFYGCGSIPEWGIQYSDSLLLFEFCSRDNFKRRSRMRAKLSYYLKSIWRIEERFGSRAVLLFVIDATTEKVKEFVKVEKSDEKFVFCDLETFRRISVGETLRSNIYYWWNSNEVEVISIA